MPTSRDYVWRKALELVEWRRSLTAREIHTELGSDAPSERTVRNTLDAMASFGLLKREGGQGRAPTQYLVPEHGPPQYPPGYVPRPPSSTNAGAFPYPGGKGRLVDWIVDHMPAHDTYVEVFGGSGAVLLNKPPSKYEIYNDVDGDLVQFFKTLRNREDELVEWLCTVPYSRQQYYEWAEAFYDGERPDDPIARAGQFFSLRYMQVRGDTTALNGFKVRAIRSPARTFDNARKRLHSLAERFAQVTVDSRDCVEILDGYDDDNGDVVFYLDPPYVGAEEYYDGEFDHACLVDTLHEIENDWMLSYAELPEGLEEFTIIEHQHRHRMKQSGTVTEKLVCNFDFQERMSFRAALSASAD